MAIYEVQLTADGIEVTADSHSSACRYATSDAREFMANWAIADESASPSQVGAEETLSSDDIQVEVSCEDKGGSGDRMWACEATFTAFIVAEAPEEAIATMKCLMSQ